MTPRQRRFCQYYVKTGNGAKAARQAGYGKAGDRRQATRLISTNVHVQSFIKQLSENFEEVKQLTPAHIAAGLLKEATTADVAGARVRAYEVLSRFTGGFVERQEVSKKPADELLTALAKTQPELAKLLAPLLGVELE